MREEVSCRRAVKDARNEAPPGMLVRTRIVGVDELPDSLDGKWLACSTVLAPRAVRAAAADPRWQVTYAVAEAGPETIGIVGLYRKIGKKFPAEILDPAIAAPGLFTGGHPADSYLLIGGSVDTVSGTAVSSELDPETAVAVQRELVDAGFRWASENGLTGAAMYVRDSELVAYVGAGARSRPCQQVGESATLAVPVGGWEGYVASLGHKKRSTVLRDTRAITSMGLVSREADPVQLVEEIAPLVMAVQARHNLPDHELLVQYRLSEWIAHCDGSAVAFTARDRAGHLLGACFACWHNDVLELTEIGLVDDPDVRHLVYTEIVIYAPVRFAARRGCTTIELGIESVHPKRVRGATISPVWAVAGSAAGRG